MASAWHQVQADVFTHPRGYRVQSYRDGIVPRWAAFHPSVGWFADGFLSAFAAKEYCRCHALEVGRASEG
ncbi:hypothetical protein [Chitinibacter sp. S2-10]|uniref:hypothetical protein n=1 Tax=Chitinibacter sp. S2-10 TaxID=3373597 RepID=UPI003977863F